MSQEKVERYKKEKANRKEIIKKEKRKSMLMKLGASLLGIAVVGWIGYSAYMAIESGKPQETITVNMDAVNDYMADTSTDAAE